MRLRENILSLLASYTGQPIKRIAVDADRDFVLTAEEAVKYGLVDQVIKKKEGAAA